eukprot:5040156-Prymnesium_polylepis.1
MEILRDRPQRRAAAADAPRARGIPIPVRVAAVRRAVKSPVMATSSSWGYGGMPGAVREALIR